MKTKAFVAIASMFASIAIAAAAVALTYEFAYLPVRCNRTAFVLRRTTERMQRVSDDYARIVISRNLLRDSREAIRECPENVDLYVVAAIATAQLGRPQEVADWYSRALEHERRPELFLDLGIAYCDNGRPDLGVPYLVRACLFDTSLRFISPPACGAAEVDQAVKRHLSMLQAAKRH